MRKDLPSFSSSVVTLTLSAVVSLSTTIAQAQIEPLSSSFESNLAEVPTNFFLAQDSSGVVGDTFTEPTPDKLRENLLIEPITKEKIVFPSAPGSTLGVPTGYGANWGNAYIGGALTSATRTNDVVDGSLSLGMGFGNARNAVGLEASLGIISLQDSFASDGVFGLKLHRLLDEKGYFSAAIGWENLAKWGDAGEDTLRGSAKDSLYTVFSGRFDLQPEVESNKLPLTISVGLGSGRFRSKGAVDAGEQNINLFATAGLRVIPQLSLISTWTGQELNLGTSIAPIRNVPIIINLGAADVTGVYPQGTRFIMTAGYAINF